MKEPKVHLVNLEQAPLLGVLGAVIRRQRILILDRWCGFSFARPLFLILRKILYRTGLAAPFTEIFTQSELYFTNSWRNEFPGLYERHESFLEESIGFRSFSETGDYAQACRHVASQLADDTLNLATLVFKAAKKTEPMSIKVSGVDDLVLDIFHREFADAPTVENGGCRRRMPHLINALISAAVFGRILVWLAARLSLRRPPSTPVSFAADYVPDLRYPSFLRDLVDDLGQITLVTRSPSRAQAVTPEKDWAGFAVTHPGETAVTPNDFFRLMDTACRDLWRLYKATSGQVPALFIGIAKLVWWRIVFRAWLAPGAIRFFLSRDDYNAEHIIRTQELRRVGATSVGMSHGIVAPGILVPQKRYLSYDSYYSFAQFPYDTHYRKRWDPALSLRPGGTFAMSREHLSKINGPRSNDVVFFVSRLPDEEKMVTGLRRLAALLPDRRVIIKAKYPPGYPHHSPVFEAAGNTPENLVVSWEDAYDLMLVHRFGFSTGNSTTAVEAIQFGMTVFVLDIHDKKETFFFRDYPELCVRSATEVAQRIRAIEAGSEQFDRSHYATISPLPDQLLRDEMRKNISNTRNEAAHLPQRAATPERKAS